MSDAKALTRVLDEFFWSLRRSGLAISTAQAIDACRIAKLLGLGDRDQLSLGLRAVLAHSLDEQRRFDAGFRAFFAARTRHMSLRERLSDSGLGEGELTELFAVLGAMAASSADGMAPLGAILERGAELDRLLSMVTGGLTATSTSRHQLGFATHRVLSRVGVDRARKSLAGLQSHLRDAFGEERALAIMAALKSELDQAEALTRAHVREKLIPHHLEEASSINRGQSAETTPFAALDPDEVEEVRRAVARFAARLRGRARVRKRRALRGELDPHKTLRKAMGTGGVPFRAIRKRPRRDKPSLMLLCDVSDSVRQAATFMLELVYAAQELWDGTRSFVFVSDLGETTDLFNREPIHRALGHAYGGTIISVRDNSNYGRALRAFSERHLKEIDRTTTVVILGDGRTNYHDDAAEVLDAIRGRARALLWLCPEAEGEWGVGDSAMARYAPKCTKVFDVRCAADLARAARAIVSIG